MTIPQSIGRYKVISELGRGAMGMVYRGVDPSLDRVVAIKVISALPAAGSLNTDELEARFLREARVSARINHPGVVTVYDAGREGDSLYLVMELVEGESLGQRMARRGYPTLPEALDIVAQAAEALSAAHALGVVHRDVKPANILMTPEGRVKVTDFGVAKAMGEASDLTRTGTVVGSPAYMAPEQVRGEAADGRTDLFSLGVVLYELLLRRKPFPAESITTVIYQILHEDPLAEATASTLLDDETAALLRRALAKDPAQRFQDANTLAREARALAERVPSSGGIDGAEPTRVLETQSADAMPAPVRRVPLVALAAVGAVAIIATVSFLALRGGGEGEQGDATATSPPFMMAQGQPEPPPPLVVPTPEDQVAESEPESTRAPDRPRLGWQSTAEPTGTAAATRRDTTAGNVARSPVRPTSPPAAAEPAPRAATTPTPPIVGIFECREGANFNVSPEKAEVEINGEVIGVADDWDGSLFGKLGKSYMFDDAGEYYVKLSHEGRRTSWVKIIVRREAAERIVSVNTKLARTDR